MARTREFDADKALDDAMMLFWQKGYEATSFDDIVKATGVSRYGIYDEFNSKKGLYLAVLDHYFTKVILPAMKPITDKHASIKDFHPLFDGMISLNDDLNGLQNGCLFCHSANEMANKDEDIKQFVLSCFNKAQGAFSHAIQNSVDAGEIAKDTNVESASWVIFGLLQGGATFARCGMPTEQVRDYAHAGIDLIFKKNAS